MANNVINRVWNQNRMVTIEDLKGMAFQAESGGHTFQISGVDDAGNIIALSGSVTGVFLRPDNTDVAITGSASGGVVSVTLPANCYDVPGRFGLTIFVTANGQKTAVYAAMGTVSRTSSGTVSPGTTADVVDLINQINAAVATIPASWTGLMADIAPTYSDAAVYPIGAYVYYNGDLYRCTTAITTAESWTAGHWTQAVLGNDVSDLKNAISSNATIGTIITGKFVNDSGGLSTDGNYDVCDFVDISAFIEVEFSVSMLSIRGLAFYSENKTALLVINGNNCASYGYTATSVPQLVKLAVPNAAKYLRFTRRNAFDVTATGFAVSGYSFSGIAKTVYDLKNNVAAIENDPTIVRAEYTKNLFDVDAATKNAILANQSNQTQESARYDTSDFIPVEGGKSYTISPQCRIYVLSTAKTSSSVTVYNNDNVTTPRTISVETDGFLRISYGKSIENIQVEEGSSVTPYVPYKRYIETGTKMNTAMELQAEEIARSVIISNAISVKKESDKITITSNLDGNDLVRIFYLSDPSGRNGVANFYDDYLAGNKIKEARDDIAPQRLKIKRDGNATNWTVGANHGWPVLVVNNSPLSSADVGSVWTNGTLQFVVYSVDNSGKAIFLYPCVMDGDKLSFTVTPNIGTFTHVSGGSYTTSFTVSNPSALQNMPFSVNNKTVTLYIDEKAITDDGNYTGESFRITEQYSILDYADLIEKIKSQGTSFDIDTVTPFATIVNCYEFIGNNCNITQTIIADHALTIGDSGILQATSIYDNGGTVLAYCNHVASGDLASSSLVDMSNFSTSAYATSTNAETGKVPNRFVEINRLNGVNRYAFIIGFYPDKSAGKDSERANLSTFMELRNTNKMYPSCIVNKSLSIGESVTVAGFRAYQGASDIVSDCSVKSGNKTYILVDAQETGHLTIKTPGMVGGVFETADSSGIVLQTDVIGGNGIDMMTNGGAQSATFVI